MDNTTRDTLIMNWQAAKRQLDAAKKLEMALRTEVQEALFPTAAASGTHNLDLGMGYTLKLVTKTNYNMAKSELVEAALDKIDKMGNDGPFIAERLVSWKPTLSLTEYKALNDQMKAAIDEVITTTPGAPTLTLVEPK